MPNISRTTNFYENKETTSHPSNQEKLEILVTLSVGEDLLKFVILHTAGVLSNREEKRRIIYLPSLPEMFQNVSWPFFFYMSFQINSSCSSKSCLVSSEQFFCSQLITPHFAVSTSEFQVFTRLLYCTKGHMCFTTLRTTHAQNIWHHDSCGEKMRGEL